MLKLFTVLPPEVRCVIAEYLGTHDLVSFVVNGFPEVLQVFGQYPNEILDLARQASNLYPVLNSLGFLPEDKNTAILRCINWAMVDERVAPDELEKARKIANSTGVIKRKDLRAIEQWMSNGATQLGMKKVRKIIVNHAKRCGTRLTDIQLNVVIHRLYTGGLYYSISRLSSISPKLLILDAGENHKIYIRETYNWTLLQL